MSASARWTINASGSRGLIVWRKDSRYAFVNICDVNHTVHIFALSNYANYHISEMLGKWFADWKTYIFTVLSRPPETTLSATKSTQYTSSVWPGRSILILYVFRSHSCMSA